MKRVIRASVVEAKQNSVIQKLIAMIKKELQGITTKDKTIKTEKDGSYVIERNLEDTEYGGEARSMRIRCQATEWDENDKPTKFTLYYKTDDGVQQRRVDKDVTPDQIKLTISDAVVEFYGDDFRARRNEASEGDNEE